MKFIIVCIFAFLPTSWALAQGCVAIRNFAPINTAPLFDQVPSGKKMILNITNRYFEASETYRGEKFITDTLVTNKIYTLNVNVLIMLKKGWSLGVNLPVSANSRNNSADHKGPGTTPRYTTSSFGLGDIRFSVYKWLLDPLANTKGNIQLGLGLEFPTGDYRYEDYFVRNDTTKVLAPVDQAIQLGDGGTGINAELNAFYKFGSRINVYTQGFYVANPREQNGVSNLKGRLPNATQIRNNTTVMSVPDFFSVRGGANLMFQQLVITAGMRYEKVPENDLIGGNKGFRRAASITSIEAGINYKFNTSFVFVNAGMPVKYNIIQNKQNDMTPAGFAKYVFYFGVQFYL